MGRQEGGGSSGTAVGEAVAVLLLLLFWHIPSVCCWVPEHLGAHLQSHPEPWSTYSLTLNPEAPTVSP